jgi:F-type H+-transporting ATPase subunit b
MLHLQLSTIVFQILNFLILLGLLSWFFYRPVLAAMRNRQESIDARLRDADERTREAESERARLEAQTRDARAEAEALLASARTQAGDERAQIVAGGKTEAARLLAEARQTIEEQERLAFGQLEGRVVESAITIAAKLIGQAAGPAVHQQLLEQFLQEGVFPRDSASESLDVLLGRDHSAVTVELAYPSPPETEGRIRELLLRDLGRQAGAKQPAFRVNPALIAGGRVLAGEFVADFSLRRMLEDLSSASAAKSEADR